MLSLLLANVAEIEDRKGISRVLSMPRTFRGSIEAVSISHYTRGTRGSCRCKLKASVKYVGRSGRNERMLFEE